MFSTKELIKLIKSIDDYEPNLVLAIKQFTKSYIFKTNEELKEAVNLWNTDKKECLKRYGHISEWDVSNVINMSGMFWGAKSFNQPLNDWNVSNVTRMSCMFYGTKSFNQPETLKHFGVW